MPKNPTLQAPFPWFGGKTRAAQLIWERFGNVQNYVEPFAGSLAVLLNRPSPPGIETINDLDGFICNVWRALAMAPSETAHYATWPNNECDLHARHLWLKEHRQALTARLMGDPDYYDPKMAGWWLWGIANWIGGSWCVAGSSGPWGIVHDAQGWGTQGMACRGDDST
jgi:DNA adenine methylase